MLAPLNILIRTRHYSDKAAEFCRRHHINARFVLANRLIREEQINRVITSEPLFQIPLPLTFGQEVAAVSHSSNHRVAIKPAVNKEHCTECTRQRDGAYLL